MVTGMEKPYVVGMDIGGTNTVFGIVDSRGNVLATDSVKTQLFLNRGLCRGGQFKVASVD